jgi:hypothetical protein
MSDLDLHRQKMERFATHRIDVATDCTSPAQMFVTVWNCVSRMSGDPRYLNGTRGREGRIHGILRIL